MHVWTERTVHVVQLCSLTDDAWTGRCLELGGNILPLRSCLYSDRSDTLSGLSDERAAPTWWL